MKPEFWPSNVAWNDNIKIIMEAETYPPYYILSNGTEIKGELKPKHLKKLKEEKQSKRKRKRKRKTSRRY